MGECESRIERNLVESWVVTNDVEKCRVEYLEERRASRSWIEEFRKRVLTEMPIWSQDSERTRINEL